MVFNSYGDGPISQNTSVREFFVLPVVSEYPDYSIEPNGDVIIKMVSGHLFRISAKKFSVKEFAPGSFTEKTLSKNNKGGLEFSLRSGYWIDGGYKLGASFLSENPTANSIVRSSASSKSCSIKNKDFLSYVGGGDFFPLHSGSEQTAFFSQRCPELKIK
jgi:hypothetical protein